ncbi:MAG TPA: lipopolysaccharide kinase InaA family protein [Candidatus Binataceae bacterium]|nr:lipopolysaccharide kinase InaA family protein [Candidatus Binataceae bacterium]
MPAQAHYSQKFRADLIDSALAAIAGSLKWRVRRSRYAETWRARIGAPDGPVAYFKILDPARGMRAIARWIQIAGMHHVAAITASLRRDGFGAPEVLLIGQEQSGGREIVVTRRVAGTAAPRHLREHRGDIKAKRAILWALGSEIARLHRAGYLHGDLTPYNVFVAASIPPSFSFIDHERTRRTWLSRFERPRLRNFVQLGHFEFDGLTNTDRMRVWCGYASAIRPQSRRSARKRVVAMIRARIARDGSRSKPEPAVIVRRREVGKG